MGTNYYLKQSAKVCASCGHDAGSQTRHIGKSSAGWCFSLHVIPEDGINDLPDWEREWSKPGVTIEDEYGRSVSLEEMRKIITERKWKSDFTSAPADYLSWESFHAANHSTEGPNGLVRHRIERGYCIGHGEGTWDRIVGDFS